MTDKPVRQSSVRGRGDVADIHLEIDADVYRAFQAHCRKLRLPQYLVFELLVESWIRGDEARMEWEEIVRLVDAWHKRQSDDSTPSALPGNRRGGDES